METDGSHNEAIALLRRNLKLLLIYLAKKSETPSADLESLLHEVIQELYEESKQALESKRRHLKVVYEG